MNIFDLASFAKSKGVPFVSKVWNCSVQNVYQEIKSDRDISFEVEEDKKEIRTVEKKVLNTVTFKEIGWE